MAISMLPPSTLYPVAALNDTWNPAGAWIVTFDRRSVPVTVKLPGATPGTPTLAVIPDSPVLFPAARFGFGTVAVTSNVNADASASFPSVTVAVFVEFSCPASGVNVTPNVVFPPAATVRLPSAGLMLNPWLAVTDGAVSVSGPVPLFSTVIVFVTVPAHTGRSPNPTVELPLDSVVVPSFTVIVGTVPVSPTSVGDSSSLLAMLIVALYDPTVPGVYVTVTVRAAPPAKIEKLVGLALNLPLPPPLNVIPLTVSVSVPSFPTVNSFVALPPARTAPKSQLEGLTEITGFGAASGVTVPSAYSAQLPPPTAVSFQPYSVNGSVVSPLTVTGLVTSPPSAP